MIFGFIGSGKMAAALVQGVVKAGAIAREEIVVADTHASTAEALSRAAGVRVASGNEELARLADVLVLCVKPGDALAALRSLDCTGKLVISIVAGLTIAALEEAAGAGARIVRVMPNTPALVNKGAAGFSLGHQATSEDAAVTEKIFGSVGNAFLVKESLLDVVTGLSGSGPAYVFLIIEALADGGVLMGLPRESALKLAAQTVAGAAELVLQTGEHPAVLRDMVTSPGGTTIAGIEALEANGARSALISAVRAATERAREIGRLK
ncbi:MAG: Pyrroline-5-carboxylate reductase [Chthoniobacteraceae bacterium]|nr:Pyrroline-5-carboxylate reductase [Chthoniobacteraceae bacterium]